MKIPHLLERLFPSDCVGREGRYAGLIDIPFSMKMYLSRYIGGFIFDELCEWMFCPRIVPRGYV